MYYKIWTFLLPQHNAEQGRTQQRIILHGNEEKRKGSSGAGEKPLGRRGFQILIAYCLLTSARLDRVGFAKAEQYKKDMV